MRPKTDTQPVATLRDRILAAADDLFRKQGIRGVGVEAIAEAAGTNKMTLYRYFDSKDELIAAWVGGIIAQKDAEWDELSTKHKDDPTGLLQAWSKRVAEKLAAMEGRGSILHAAIAELPERDHPARRVIQGYKQREHRRVRRLCEDAGFQNPELAANLFYMMLEGATNCVSCVGTKQIGEHLVQLVDLMVENSRTRGRQPQRL
ncbi:MAG: TetR/AcrR family transcriptional regulator [Gemmatimonadaceae bacterium]